MAGSTALACAVHGAQVAWIGPTFRNSRHLWKFCVEKTFRISHALDINKTEREIGFPGGGNIGIYTADNDVSIRGNFFDLVVVDEAPQIKAETYTDAILPTLADRDGMAYLIGTPKGRNWFWMEFVKAQAEGRAFTAPSNANPLPNIQNAFKLARERVSERSFRQEWLAEFVEEGSGVFRKVRESSTSVPQISAVKGHSYIVGVDWGRTNDATTFKVIDTALNAEVYSDRMIETNYDLQVGRLKALVGLFNPILIIAEYNAMGGPLVERLQMDGLPVQAFITTNASKMAAIDALSLAFERGKLKILPDELTIAELQAYESKRLPGGMISYSAPPGMHDDTVMALALAWSGVIEGGLIAWGGDG